jgi:dihydropteroate synthase-like protein
MDDSGSHPTCRVVVHLFERIKERTPYCWKGTSYHIRLISITISENGGMKLKLHLFTGRLAGELVRKYAKESGTSHDIQVHVLPVSNASFIDQSMILEEIDEQRLDEDPRDRLILVSGMVSGDLAEIEKKTGLKIRKGPVHVADLPFILKNLNLTMLRTDKSADAFITELGQEMYSEAISRAVTAVKEDSVQGNWFEIPTPKGSLTVGTGFPPLIIAEIADATLLELDEVVNRALAFASAGADVIDIGATVQEPRPRKVTAIFDALLSERGLMNHAFSIDSLRPSEILAAVSAGASIVLSIDAGNEQEVLGGMQKEKIEPGSVVLTVLPTNVKHGMIPRTASGRAEKVASFTRSLYERGWIKLFGDPLLESPIFPGILKSLIAYNVLRSKEPQLPLLMGIGNVTEMLDADPLGVNALLACIAVELDAGAVLTTEVTTTTTHKTRNTIGYLVEALRLAYVAADRQRPPKDLPFSVFTCRSKYSSEEPDIELIAQEASAKETLFVETHEGFIEKVMGTSFKPSNIIISEDSETGVKFDPSGYFTIYTLHDAGVILLKWYDSSTNTLKGIFFGRNARSLGRIATKYIPQMRLDHAVYLGRELQKAEVALCFNGRYIQDEELIKT